jgi:hypothetical protein
MGAGVQRSDRARGGFTPKCSPRLHVAAIARGDLTSSIAELERCVTQMGFIGCNLNPDPGGGHFKHPPLTDEYWFPFYEKMVELDVPAMIHVSGSCNPAMHATGAYYIAADTIAFMQLLEGDLFSRFPRCASSSRMAAGRCPITGAAIGGWPIC